MDDVFHSVSMIMNVDPEEIAKIVHDYINRGIVSDYDRLNCPKPPIYIGPVKVKTLKERLEEMKMKATSVQTIENVKEMHFTIEKSCVDDITKVIVGASTNDDIFEFHFSGEGCVVFANQWFNMVADKAYKADFESERNKRQMMERENSILRKNIRELEEELGRWKQLQEENENLKKRYDRLNKKFNRVMNDNLPETPITDAMIVDDYNRLVEENKQLREDKEYAEKLNKELIDRWQKRYGDILEENKLLKKELVFEKAANEAQHKFIKEYAGRGTEVQFNYVVNESDNEVSYVIVDKKTYDEKPNINLHGKDFTPDELVDRVLELEEENDRFKKQLHAVQLMLDNFRKDHEDILKTQREKHEDEVEQLNKLLTLYEKRLDELIKEKKNLIEENENLKKHVRLQIDDKGKVIKSNDKLREKIGELKEENENLKKAYDILDKALDGSQKTCNKWYEKCIKMLYEQDGHTKLQEEKIADNVNHPSHYTGKYECIDVMQDVFGDEATDNFCLCNAFKYIWRARKKNGLEDVKKAVWYLNKYIEEAEKDGVPKGK